MSELDPMPTPQTVLVSGATGLVGSVLCPVLEDRGHTVRTLSRSSGDVLWDVDKGELASDALDGVDAIIHLAGEPIAQRWTDSAKKRILKSRVDGTALLAKAAAAQAEKPALIMASGSNYYGYQRSGVMAEEASGGKGFLADVCLQWEAAAQPLLDAGGRVVAVRTGVVLSQEGGALAKLLPPFKMGVGGRVGSGNQRMSWIGLRDLIAIYCFALEKETIRGPLNAVAPHSVTNAEFTRKLGRLLRRPTVFPLPSSMVKLLFGEMGQETILADVELAPARLKSLGFEWQAPDIEKALQVALGKMEYIEELPA